MQTGCTQPPLTSVSNSCRCLASAASLAAMLLISACGSTSWQSMAGEQAQHSLLAGYDADRERNMKASNNEHTMEAVPATAQRRAGDLDPFYPLFNVRADQQPKSRVPSLLLQSESSCCSNTAGTYLQLQPLSPESSLRLCCRCCQPLLRHRLQLVKL